MSCGNIVKCNNCPCQFKIKNYGTSDLSRITLTGSDRTTLNWSEISVPEVLDIPDAKPVIESIDQVYVTSEIKNIELIQTPFAYKSYRTYDISVDELALIDDLATAVTNGLPDLEAVSDAITTFIGVINGLGVTVPGAIGTILGHLTQAATDLDTAATAVTAALDAVVAITINYSICTVITLLRNLYNSLNGVSLILTRVLELVNELVTAVATFPVLEPFADVISGAVSVLVATINAAFTAIAGLLTLIINLINQLTAHNFMVITPNEEGTVLTGRKLIVEGVLNQKIVYTANVDDQSVHSAHFCVPYSAFVVPYASFEGLTYAENITVVTNQNTCTTAVVNGFYFDPNVPVVPDLEEEFTVEVYVEDVFVYPLDLRTIFKNITLFLQGKIAVC